jgi:photosynthetic reaction center H subunit
MEIGAITGHIDVAQIVLYLFWAFFFVLVLYLHREGKREGYPLVTERGGALMGFPEPPSAKTFLLDNGRGSHVVEGNPDRRQLPLKKLWAGDGGPYEPIGNPMLAGVGPGSYAERADVPDITLHGTPRIVPLRVARDFGPAVEDTDPRGMPVLGADRVQGGTVVDLWIDKAEYVLRYYELEVGSPTAPRRALLPANFAQFDKDGKSILVLSIMGKHFRDVPALKNPDQVTLLEEEKIMAYYGAGTLYAEPSRAEPLLEPYWT